MIRVGLGFDAHAFDERRALMLGGVEITGSPGLSGHSDGDVLSHAIADALLSASRVSDLGSSFPNTPKWKDASSLVILAETAHILSVAGWTIGNIDATLVAQSPSLAPYRDEMISELAAALSVEPSTIWVKATTSDGLGFTGRSEGIAALALAVVERED